jgi:hypothetical protein
MRQKNTAADSDAACLRTNGGSKDGRLACDNGSHIMMLS